MEAFETIVRTLLVQDRYWVLDGYKVALTKDEKQAIGRPSAPRWDIDLLAYKAHENVLYAVECKSYFDSGGVDLVSLSQFSSRYADRYKLFNDTNLRAIVLSRLSAQLVEDGLVPEGVSVTLGLAAGCVYSVFDDQKIGEWLNAQGWKYWSPRWIAEHLGKLAQTSYYNDVAIIAAKILERNRIANTK